MYQGTAEACKETFKKFCEDVFENNDDPSLTNFLKSVNNLYLTFNLDNRGVQRTIF